MVVIGEASRTLKLEIFSLLFFVIELQFLKSISEACFTVQYRTLISATHVRFIQAEITAEMFTPADAASFV